MRLSDLLGIAWVFFLLAYLMFIDMFIPKDDVLMRSIAVFGGIILFIGLMFAEEFILQVMYSKYKVLKARIYPSREEVSFIIKDIKSVKHDKEELWLNILELGKPYNHREFKKVNRVYIISPKPLEELVSFLPKERALNIAGIVIDHPSIGFADLEETKTPYMEHAQPTPVYILVYADKTGYMEYNIDKDVKELQAENLNLKATISAMREKMIALEEQLMATIDQLKGLLKAKYDINKQVVMELLAFGEHYGGFWNAYRALTGQKRIPISWSAITTIIITVLAFAYLYLHPELLYYLYQNWIITVIILGVVFAGLYYVYRAKHRAR